MVSKRDGQIVLPILDFQTIEDWSQQCVKTCSILWLPHIMRVVVNNKNELKAGKTRARISINKQRRMCCKLSK